MNRETDISQVASSHTSPPGKKSISQPRRPSGWKNLTPAEMRVVELVLEGLTNPQAGERLGISRRTVSSHLSAVFRKLGIHSRIDLILQAPAPLKRRAAARPQAKPSGGEESLAQPVAADQTPGYPQ